MAELQKHLAYEVDWLVFAARRFRETGAEGRRARGTVRSFTLGTCWSSRSRADPNPPPWKKDDGPSNGWWISREFGGVRPTDTHPSEFKPWSKLIHENVAHLAKERRKGALA